MDLDVIALDRARARSVAAVRVVTRGYLMTAALHAGDADRMDLTTTWSDEHRRRRDFAFGFAWRALSEWFSIAWDLSERPSLLAAWREESAAPAASITNAYSRLRALATATPPRGVGRSMEPNALMYFSDARRDLEAIVAVPLRTVAYDGNGEIVEPADFASLIESELEQIERFEERERLRLDAMFVPVFGRILRPEDEGA